MATPDRYWRIKEIFAAAVDMPAEERDRFLVMACAGDDQLRKEVDDLLQVHDRAPGITLPPLDPSATSSRPDPFTESPGTVIGSYTIREMIGEGGMGVVYKAEQLAPIRRVVALKLIKLGMDTRHVISRFQSERQALAMMNHRNVAAVYDAGATDLGRPYFVMEYVPGTPITSFCDQHRYDTRQRLQLFVQACEAIQHAHQKAIIHRDIKPGNILVAMESDVPVVKVIDFGVAKATAPQLTERTMFTERGQLIGTPEYMSPEQADLNAVDVDTRTDIYSLGVVLYELLAGALPFDSKMLREAAYAQIQAIIREVDPPTPSARLSSLGNIAAEEVAVRHGTKRAAMERELRNELEWIPLKAMRKEPQRRYASAGEMAQDIVHYLQDEPLQAAPESKAYRLRKALKRNKGPVVAAAAMLVILLAGITGTTIGLIGETRQRRLAQEQRANAQRQELEATRQAAIAGAVSRFQSDMLASADPDKLLGDRVTVLEATLAAIRELDAGKLREQPLVEASVRQTIGDTLRSLGRYDAAKQNLKKAVELRSSLLSPGDPAIAQALGSLGLTAIDQGRFAEAEPLLTRALQIRQSSLPAGHRDIAMSINNVGLLYDMQGKYAQAEQTHREALAAYRAAAPADDPEIGVSLNNLAAILTKQGKYSEAEATYRDALAIYRKHLPLGTLRYATCIDNLGDVTNAQGRPAEAEQLFREAYDIRKRVLPAGHDGLTISLSHISESLYGQGRFAEAEPLAVEVVAAIRNAHPEPHPQVAAQLSLLMAVLIAQNRYAEAEPLAREALEIQRKVLPHDHPELAGALGNFAVVARNLGRLPEAEQATREALEIQRKVLPVGHPDIATTLNNLSRILRAQQKYDQAEAALREALDTYVRAKRADDAWVGNARLGLGATLLALKRYPESEAELVESERILSTAQAVPRGRHQQCIQALIALYTEWHRSDPDGGHAAAAERWRGRLPATNPSTATPQTPSTGPSTTQAADR